MIRRILLTAASVTLIVSLLGTYGCIFNPSEGGGGNIEEIKWPDLTDKEDPIETMRILYTNFKVLSSDQIEEKYGNILYDDPADVNDYVWYMSDYDVNVQGYDPIMTRNEDIEGTKYLLTNASSMEFTISQGTWVESAVCEDCWQTTRLYSFHTNVLVQGEYKEFIGTDMQVIFIIGPKAGEPGKYVIRQANDYGAPQ